MSVKSWLKKLFFGKTFEKELNRDATTGHFVSDEYVKENPATTTTEKREVKKRGKK